MVVIARVWSDAVALVLFLTRPLSDYLFALIYRLFIGGTKPLPPIRNKMLLIPATELAAKIRKRQLKCEDVMQAYIDRARDVQPYINAIVDARYEDALKEARAIDKFLSTSGKSPEELEKDTPLLGVPFSCKEAIGVKGLTQTAGIVRIKDRLAEEDSDASSLLRKSGAIPVTVTNVPEMCMWWDTSNMIFGMTKNPYNPARTCGGSTGGEGALIAAAGSVIGIGNDIAGSIRIPCSFNGIYGHKPSSGVRKSLTLLVDLRKKNDSKGGLEDEKHENKVENFVSTGPMCRYAADLPLLLKILSGDDQRLQLQREIDFRKVKVYYMEEFPDKFLASVPDIKKAIRKAANFFEEKFEIKAIPLRIEELKNSLYLWQCKVLETDVLPFKNSLADENGKINLWLELLKSIFGLSKHTQQAIFFAMIDKQDKNQSYYNALKQYERLEQKFLELFEEKAIVLVPAHPEPPTFNCLTIPKYKNIGYTAIFNVLGFPSTNVPTGMSNGVPIGIQVVSGHFMDSLTVAAALELDKLFCGWKSPCSIAVRD